MTARTASRNTLALGSALANEDVREAGKSFVAGGLYASGIVLIGGLIAATMTNSVLPTLVEVVAPDRMPRYTAHEIARADRYNPDQWTFPATDTAQQQTVMIETARPAHNGEARMQLATAE